MTLDGVRRPDLQAVLAGLKDFQRDTVEYVCERLYGEDAISRFLIADEVGLGKTLVARGVIARAIDRLWDHHEHINIVYICSNQAIARQNIDRLNVTRDHSFQHASRATLLPITLQSMRQNRLNFVSLTPGTSFNLRSSTGRWEERVVLYCLLREHWKVTPGRLSNLLRCGVRWDTWRERLPGYARWYSKRLDPELTDAFYRALDEQPELRQTYDRVSKMIGGTRKHLTLEMARERNTLVGDLRALLAQSSLRALQPQLVIMDEFQRFRSLLAEDEEMGLLAHEIFSFPDVKVLLLSATPYKWYTLEDEQGEDHYQDFYRTIEFLLRDQPGQAQSLKQAVEAYRQAMLRLDVGALDDLSATKTGLENLLRQVMVRTERLAVSSNRNGMLEEVLTADDRLQSEDIVDYVHLDRIACLFEAGDQIEYWKSSGYVLNLMERYALKESFRAVCGQQLPDVAAVIREGSDALLDWPIIESYLPIDSRNARLRALRESSLDTGNWRLLWMPASLPYYAPAGPFADVGAAGATKSLVFSAWRLVPKAIALLLSYEAERQMLADEDRDYAYSELLQKRGPLLNFAMSQGRLTGMPIFCLAYPSPGLAKALDPAALGCASMNGAVIDREVIVKEAKTQIEALLGRATGGLGTGQAGRADHDWYWLSAALIDHQDNHPGLRSWLAEKGDLAWEHMVERHKSSGSDDSGDAAGFRQHVEVLKGRAAQPDELGPQPDDLTTLLAQIALASPAVVTLRALLRVLNPTTEDEWASLLSASARIALGFRSMFNQPEVIALLQSCYPESHTIQPYWQKVLLYCLDGNLQAVMDEYIHVLYESMGLVGHSVCDCAVKLAERLSMVVSLRAATLRFDEVLDPVDDLVDMTSRGIRCRYALRYGSDASMDWQEGVRDEEVWTAFNSPFRPFVLATTSIGQEGLDFHQYCHRVVHWNLPSNPVDLEQREGRVHRYKGHVIRRNLGEHYGLSALRPDGGDPWSQLFALAIRDRPAEANDLVPFWIYEPTNGQGIVHKIERQVPLFPLSREVGKLEALKNALAAYRCVIGQPRQQEMLSFLTTRLGPAGVAAVAESVALDLSPRPRDLPGR